MAISTIKELRERHHAALTDVRIEIPQQWLDTVDDLMNALYQAGFDASKHKVKVIKEKWWELRIYFDGIEDRALEAVLDDIVEAYSLKAQAVFNCHPLAP